jgi:uncharacterized protein YndB with AHSA1/START domain
MSVPRPEPPRRPFWMKALLVVGVAIVLANAAAFLYGLTLSDEWHVEESIIIDAPPAEIYPLLATPKRWPEWSVWNRERDPTVEFAYEGPESGVDASFAWRGEQLGLGKMTITEAEADSFVRYRLVLQGAEFSPNGRIALEPAGGTKVTWTDGGSLGNTLGRLFRERLENSVASEFRASLGRLKKIVEENGRSENGRTAE